MELDDVELDRPKDGPPLSCRTNRDSMVNMCSSEQN